MEEMKVFKEQTEEFGEITVVVIDGECYFLFGEINNVMQLERRSRFMQSGYTREAFERVQEVNGWRIEGIPEIGGQLLINFHGVRECYKVARCSLYIWADDEGICRKEEKEMKKRLLCFVQKVGDFMIKYKDTQSQRKANEPYRKAVSAITGEEI